MLLRVWKLLGLQVGIERRTFPADIRGDRSHRERSMCLTAVRLCFYVLMLVFINQSVFIASCVLVLLNYGQLILQMDGETVETEADFILGGSKITADGDCSNEIKRRLLLGRKVMTNLDSIWKSRDITLHTKVHLVKAMVFPVVMYGCESWTVKKAELSTALRTTVHNTKDDVGIGIYQYWYLSHIGIYQCLFALHHVCSFYPIMGS